MATTQNSSAGTVVVQVQSLARAAAGGSGGSGGGTGTLCDELIGALDVVAETVSATAGVTRTYRTEQGVSTITAATPEECDALERERRVGLMFPVANKDGAAVTYDPAALELCFRPAGVDALADAEKALTTIQATHARVYRLELHDRYPLNAETAPAFFQLVLSHLHLLPELRRLRAHTILIRLPSRELAQTIAGELAHLPQLAELQLDIRGLPLQPLLEARRHTPVLRLLSSGDPKKQQLYTCLHELADGVTDVANLQEMDFSSYNTASGLPSDLVLTCVEHMPKLRKLRLPGESYWQDELDVQRLADALRAMTDLQVLDYSRPQKSYKSGDRLHSLAPLAQLIEDGGLQELTELVVTDRYAGAALPFTKLRKLRKLKITDMERMNAEGFFRVVDATMNCPPGCEIQQCRGAVSLQNFGISCDTQTRTITKTYWDGLAVEVDADAALKHVPTDPRSWFCNARMVTPLSPFKRAFTLMKGLATVADPALDLSVIITTYAANGDWAWAGISIAIMVFSTLYGCFECWQNDRRDLIPWQLLSLSVLRESYLTAVGNLRVNLFAPSTKDCMAGPPAVQALSAHEATFESLPQFILQLYVAVRQGFTTLLLVSMLVSYALLVNSITGADLLAAKSRETVVPLQVALQFAYRAVDSGTQVLLFALFIDAFRYWILLPLCVQFVIHWCGFVLLSTGKDELKDVVNHIFLPLRMLVAGPGFATFRPMWARSAGWWDLYECFSTVFRFVWYCTAIGLLWQLNSDTVSSQFVAALTVATVLGGVHVAAGVFVFSVLCSECCATPSNIFSIGFRG